MSVAYMHPRQLMMMQMPMLTAADRPVQFSPHQQYHFEQQRKYKLDQQQQKQMMWHARSMESGLGNWNHICSRLLYLLSRLFFYCRCVA